MLPSWLRNLPRWARKQRSSTLIIGRNIRFLLSKADVKEGDLDAVSSVRQKRSFDSSLGIYHLRVRYTPKSCRA